MTVILAIDGIDAAGKSTIIREIVARDSSLSSICEFSPTKLGDLIRDIITRDRFFSIAGHGGKQLEAAKSYLLLADTVAKIEKAVSSNQGRAIVMERGFLSVFGYQLSRMRSQDLLRQADAFRTSVIGVINSLTRLQAIKYGEILLVVSRETIIRRIAARGEVELASPQLQLLIDAQEVMVGLAQSFNWPMVTNNADGAFSATSTVITQQLAELKPIVGVKYV
jgi:thymidylate kinase